MSERNGVGAPKSCGVAQRAANDFAQHVAAAFVRGNHSIGDEKCGGAGVVGDDAKRGLANFGSCDDVTLVRRA